MDNDLQLIDYQLQILAAKAKAEGELSLEDIKKLEALCRSKVMLIKLTTDSEDNEQPLDLTPEQLTELLKK